MQSTLHWYEEWCSTSMSISWQYCYVWLLSASYLSVDVGQLQTFTHIALMTQCTDGSSVDLLTALDQVGMKLAPLIFHLQKSEGLKSFMECCCALQREYLSEIPEKVVSKSGIYWFSCYHGFAVVCCQCWLTCFKIIVIRCDFSFNSGCVVKT